MGDRLAHALVVERLHLGVEVQEAELGRPQHRDLDALLLLHALDPFLVLAPVDDVELARGEGEVARRIGREQPVDDAVDLRRAAEIPLVGREGHALVRLVGLELERTRADRIEAEVLAELLHRLAAEDEAAVVVGDEPEEGRHRLLQLDPDRVGIDRLDGFDRGVVGVERGRFLIAGALEREHHVVGGELAEIAVELDALAQMKGPVGLVGRAFPALGEVGLEPLEACRAGLEAHEAVEHPGGQRLVLRRRGAVRVELVHVRRRHADVQRRLGACRAGERESRRGGEKKWSHPGVPLAGSCSNRVPVGRHRNASRAAAKQLLGGLNARHPRSSRPACPSSPRSGRSGRARAARRSGRR